MREIKKTFLSLSTPFLFTLFKAMDELHSPFVEIVYHHFYYCVITCLTRTIKFSGSQFHPLLRSKVLPFMALVTSLYFSFVQHFYFVLHHFYMHCYQTVNLKDCTLVTYAFTSTSSPVFCIKQVLSVEVNSLKSYYLLLPCLTLHLSRAGCLFLKKIFMMITPSHMYFLKVLLFFML